MAMRPGVMNRYKPSSEAEQSYAADLALAGRHAELLDAAGPAETEFRQAQARRAPGAAVRPLARAQTGGRAYAARISRRKAKAKPHIHALTADAERLLTRRETHRLNEIPAV